VAGSLTWPNFPLLDSKQPVTGNFSAQVKVIFIPESPVLNTAQMAGILVRPENVRLVQDDVSFPNDWVAVSKYVNDQGILVGCRGAWVAYTEDAVFLQIERKGNSWRCAYSKNGVNWVWNDVSVDDTKLQDKQLVISLFAYSDTDKPITVKFSDWLVWRK
jgi:hypothetical protein